MGNLFFFGGEIYSFFFGGGGGGWKQKQKSPNFNMGIFETKGMVSIFQKCLNSKFLLDYNNNDYVWTCMTLYDY